MSVSVPQERLHYMDHLRALAMLAGVFFHAALAYSPVMSGFFPTADRQTSAWVDVVVWGLHLVRMPLFFLVAGFFAAWVIDRRGGTALARQRVRRIAQLGRAHVSTPVTNAQLVCRLILEKT